MQISDCHLLADIDAIYQGVRPGRYLQQALDSIRQHLPDALLLTGDVSQDHSTESYQLLETEPRVRGLAPGHCHYAYAAVYQQIQLVGCPASSVQFLAANDWQTEDQGPQWCQWQFAAGGKVSWQFCKVG